MRPNTVYSLLDPRTNEIRYVGYSYRRFMCHLLAKGQTHKACWIKSLQNLGLQPLLSFVCIVEGEQEAKRIEVALIALLRSQGVDLTNLTIGGDGVMAGRKHSEITKQKMRDVYTPERRVASSISRIGIPLTAKHLAAVMEANAEELLVRRGLAIKRGWERRNGQVTKRKRNS